MHYPFLLTSVFVSLAHAQIGTITQDINTYAAFSQQKSCAISCFQYGNLCPLDILGNKIGCAQTNCETKSWQARNDCYCKSDLQSPAQEHLSSCISDACSVVDVSVDISSAVSIYARYCSDKGYTAGLPQTAEANPTDSNATPQSTTTKGLGGSPTSSSTSGSTTGTTTGTGETSSESSKLSLSAIIGIVVGSLAGLAFLSVALWYLKKCLSPCFGKKPHYQQQLPLHDQKPIFPSYPDHQLYHPTPTPGSEVGPNDSVSMVGGVAPPAPTLVSDARYPGRWPTTNVTRPTYY